MFAPLFWDQSLEGPSFEEGWGSVKAEPVYPIRCLGLCPSAFLSLIPSLSTSRSCTETQTFGVRTLWLSEDLTTLTSSQTPPTPPSLLTWPLFLLPCHWRLSFYPGFRSLTVMCLGVGLYWFILPSTLCPFNMRLMSSFHSEKCYYLCGVSYLFLFFLERV